MSTPRVSILLPVRNEEQTLPAALISLQRQTMADWELVAVNDGSSDATPEILDDAATSDPRIRVLHQQAGGLIQALNIGLRECRADLVARMDGDDICHPRRLELQVHYLQSNPQTGLVACQVRHVPRPLIKGGFLAYEQWQNNLLDHASIMRDMFVESPFAHPSVMFRKGVAEQLSGYRDLGWAEDYDLWLRMAHAGIRFARIPQTLLFWRDRPTRLSRTGAHYTLESFRRCKAHFLSQGFLAGQQQVTLWGAGLEGKAWRKVLADYGIGIERWVEIAPNKIGQTIHGAAVISYKQLAPGPGKTLITIGAKGARDQVRAFATERGLVEGEHYICVT